jgi:uncharacterized SAM-binding protein YcdF (DUF218 family)
MKSYEVDELARKIWDYHHLNHKLKKTDCIFVLGSNDLRVAEYGAKIFLKGYAPIIIFSGGIAHQNDLLKTKYKKSEAETFAQRAIELGVPKNKIIIENKSTNTGENITFTEKILKEKGLNFKSFIIVQKPYMERRAFATIKIYWPDKDIIVTSPRLEFNEYPNNEITKDDLINIMVGDLERIKIYPQKGFQIFQEIPEDVWEAYEKLVRFGYTKHLLKL